MHFVVWRGVAIGCSPFLAGGILVSSGAEARMVATFWPHFFRDHHDMWLSMGKLLFAYNWQLIDARTFCRRRGIA